MRRPVLVMAALLWTCGAWGAWGCSSASSDGSGNGTNATSPTASSSSSPDPGTGPTTKKDAGALPDTGPDMFDSGLVETCNPPADSNQVYQYSEENLAGTMNVSMCSFRGKVALFVNVASYCGNTPQYAPLQALWEKYRDQGFYVLAFPCNQFGSQEPGDAAAISQFCTDHYGITFPMFQKIEVNGTGADPIYKWLKAQPVPSGNPTGDIEWNFAKFLVGRDGKVIKRYAASSDPGVDPLKSIINADIQAALAK